MSNARKQELQRELARLRGELFTITDDEERAAARALVGHCFKYRNSYSCPETDADHWWLYAKVLDVAKYGNVRVLSFQIDKDGKADINIASDKLAVMYAGTGTLGGRYVRIGDAEFQRALAHFMDHVSALAREVK